MTENKQGAVRKLVARALAAGVLLLLYAVSTIAVTGVMTATTDTAAYARGGRGGRNGARGIGRGRGGGRGRGYWRGGIWVPWVGPLCHRPWSSRRVYCVY